MSVANIGTHFASATALGRGRARLSVTASSRLRMPLTVASDSTTSPFFDQLFPLKETFMKTLLKRAGFAATALFLVTAANAQVTIGEPWVRATVPQQSGTGAFMSLKAEKDTALVAAESPVAKYVEVHEMAMENNVMKMREVPRIALPAGQTVELKPGGYHIMLIDLHAQVKEGEQVPLKLIFEDADGTRSAMELQAPVRPLASGAGGQQHAVDHGHGHGHGAAKH